MPGHILSEGRCPTVRWRGNYISTRYCSKVALKFYLVISQSKKFWQIHLLKQKTCRSAAKSMLRKQPQRRNKQAECPSSWELIIKKRYKKNTGIVWIAVPFSPSQVRAEDHGDGPEESLINIVLRLTKALCWAAGTCCPCIGTFRGTYRAACLRATHVLPEELLLELLLFQLLFPIMKSPCHSFSVLFPRLVLAIRKSV